MFYAHIVLAKKGPLARIWLAAHWDKKLTKAHVFETNIEQSIDGIMQPKVKLALRTSGHLLLGVVRIYSRKAKYLLADCNEAFVKIKMAFRPGIVDLPEEHREANVNAITLPEVFHDFDTALPELNDVDIEAQFSINQSRADEITMREDYGSLPMNIHDDGFGDMGFDADTPDMARAGMDGELFPEAMDDENINIVEKEPVPGPSSRLLETLHSNEGFGDEFQETAPGLFEGDIFESTPMRPNILPEQAAPADDSDDDDGHFDDGAPSPMPSSDGSRPGSPMPVSSLNQLLETDKPVTEEQQPVVADEKETEEHDDTLVAQAHEEGFALAPVDSALVKGFSNKSKRKRKLIIDEVKNISGDEMKNQLANTSDIVTTLDLAPPTKRLMFWKETGGVEKLFALPSRDIPSRAIFKNYQRHLTTTPVGLEDFSKLGPVELIVVEQQQQPHHQQAGDGITSPPPKRRRRQKSPEAPILPPPPPTPLAATITADQSSLAEPERIRDQMQPPLTDFSVESFQRDSMMTTDKTLEPSNVFDQMIPPGGLTPTGLDHGGMTPNHVIEQIESIPNLPVDQVSSILNAPEMDGYANMGYDNQTGHMGDHDWDGDYGFPQSVGAPAGLDEQQGVDETTEQFEERVLNKRAAQLFVTVRAKIQKREPIYLSEMTVRNNRKQAAQKFYSLLVLKKFQALSLAQTESYGDIQITKGPMFENPTL